MVRGGEVEINPAQWAICFRLAQNDRHLFIEGNSVTQVGSAILVGLYRFLHQGYQGAFAFLRGLVEANDVLFECLQGFSDFRLKGLNGHVEILIGQSPKRKRFGVPEDCLMGMSHRYRVWCRGGNEPRLSESQCGNALL